MGPTNREFLKEDAHQRNNRLQFTLRQSVLFTLYLVFIVVLTSVVIGISFFVTNSEESAWHDRQLEATYGAARTVEAFLAHHTLTLANLGLLDGDYLRDHPEVLPAIMAQNPALQEIVVVNPNGMVLANAHSDSLMIAEPEIIAEAIWFLQTRAGEVHLGNVQVPAGADPYLILATPAATGNVVAARVNMGILREVVSSVRFGETGIVFIIDRERNVIAHAELANEYTPDLAGERSPLRLVLSPNALEESSPSFSTMSDQHKDVIHWHGDYLNFDGRLVESLIMALPGTEWYVVGEVDVFETTTISRRALVVLGGSMVIFALLVIFFSGWLLDKRLFGPIALLRQGAQRVGAGRLDHRIPAVGNTEIGQVAQAFNDMAAHLHARQLEFVAQTAALNEEVEQRRHAQEALQRVHDELEATVAARTQELRTANQQLEAELSQHRQSQEALASMEARLRHLLLTTPAIIFSVRHEGGLRITYISNNIQDATGYSPDQYYADPKFGVVKMHPDDGDLVLAQIDRLKTEDRISYEYRFLVSSGEYKWFHDDAVAVYDEQGNIREIVGSIIDIDERKRVEAEQAAIRDHALEASRLKSEFLATVSHEIRTPLNGVIGMADLLLSTKLDNEQTEYVKTIAYSADSLLVIINDVLDLSKVEAGKLTLLESDFAPAQVAQSVADLLLPRAREKGIALRVNLSPELPAHARGYEARVRQVLLNLVGNAVKFTEQGEVTLSVAPVLQERGAGETPVKFVCFTVSDTGIGLDESNYGKLFQPFSQVDSSLARKYGGTGLGLAISKRLVELMGGEIGVESVVGKGSDFWFMVPLHPVTEEEIESHADGEFAPRRHFVFDDADREAAKAEHAPESNLVSNPGSDPVLNPAPDSVADRVTDTRHDPVPDAAPQTVLGGAAKPETAATGKPEILLVEDNLVNQKVALAQLRRLGYAVHAVSNGREAVEAVEQQPWAVVLMDCQMPEMDGFEATRLIREWEERTSRHVPIIAMTANAMNGDREACLKAGMNDYLAKPTRVEELHAVLKKWIEE